MSSDTLLVNCNPKQRENNLLRIFLHIKKISSHLQQDLKQSNLFNNLKKYKGTFFFLLNKFFLHCWMWYFDSRTSWQNPGRRNAILLIKLLMSSSLLSVLHFFLSGKWHNHFWFCKREISIVYLIIAIHQPEPQSRLSVSSGNEGEKKGHFSH